MKEIKSILNFEEKQIETLNATECARVLYLIAESLREDSLISKKTQLFSYLKIKNFLNILNEVLTQNYIVSVIFILIF